jgi:hypothetical protein
VSEEGRASFGTVRDPPSGTQPIANGQIANSTRNPEAPRVRRDIQKVLLRVDCRDSCHRTNLGITQLAGSERGVHQLQLAERPSL